MTESLAASGQAVVFTESCRNPAYPTSYLHGQSLQKAARHCVLNGQNTDSQLKQIYA